MTISSLSVTLNENSIPFLHIRENAENRGSYDYEMLAGFTDLAEMFSTIAEYSPTLRAGLLMAVIELCGGDVTGEKVDNMLADAIDEDDLKHQASNN